MAKCEEEFKLADVDKDGVPAGEDPEGDIWTVGFRMQGSYNQGNTTRQTIAELLSLNLNTVNELFILETVASAVAGLPALAAAPDGSDLLRGLAGRLP